MNYWYKEHANQKNKETKKQSHPTNCPGFVLLLFAWGFGFLWFSFFEVVSWAAFLGSKKELLKLKSKNDTILRSFWIGLGTILGDFGSDFFNFLSTCLRSRFDIDFWCFSDALQTLNFWFSHRRELNFDIFAGVDVGIDFDFQNIPNMDPKSSQDGPKKGPEGVQKSVSKFMVFWKCQRCDKIMFESSMAPFWPIMVPKRMLKMAPKSLKNLSKNGSFSNSFLDPSWEASGTPKTITKNDAKIVQDRLQVLMFFACYLLGNCFAFAE